MTVMLTGTLDCRSTEEARMVADALPEHVRLTRAEPGCLAFDVVQRADDPLTFEVSERFADRAAFEAHQERTRGSEWFSRTSGICRSYEIRETAD